MQGGVKNWPWDASVTAQRKSEVERKTTYKAYRELSNYSDRELHDIGINRGMIADAVANGRPGIDDVKAANKPVNTGGDRQAA